MKAFVSRRNSTITAQRIQNAAPKLHPRDRLETMESHPAANLTGDVDEGEANTVADRLLRRDGPADARISRASTAQRPMASCATDTVQVRTPIPLVNDVLRSSGHPLEPQARVMMESRFGHDFGRIRVYTDARAAASAKALGARAYTVGPALVFNTGEYAPRVNDGQRLLAHELTHVIQQQSSGVQIQRQPQTDPSRRVPPGPGQYTPDEYEAWLKKHPKRDYRIGGPWEPDSLYKRYRPEWFWNHGYTYAGRGGSYPYNWFEVWISDADGGKEYRVWRTPTNIEEPPSPGPSDQTPPPGPVAPAVAKFPPFLDPRADREKLFGPVVAVRENVDFFGEGDLLLYKDGTAELALTGTTKSIVFRPLPDGQWVVYWQDGKRDSHTWVIPRSEFPDPVKDAAD